MTLSPGGAVGASGSTTVTPVATTTYTLTATNLAGTVTANVTISVTRAPVITSFTAAATQINQGGSTTLTWSATGATLTQVNGSTVTGATLVIAPTQTTTYTLSVSNSAGSASQSVTVTVVIPASFQWQKAMVYGFGQLLSEESSTGPVYVMGDQVGSPNILTDATGTVVGLTKNLPFGERLDSWGVQSARRFTNHEDQPGSAIYMQARMYLPAYGKFAQVDPVYDQTKGDPETWNLYNYVTNNPVTHTDPDGRAEGGDVEPEQHQALVGFLGLPIMSMVQTMMTTGSSLASQVFDGGQPASNTNAGMETAGDSNGATTAQGVSSGVPGAAVEAGVGQAPASQGVAQFGLNFSVTLPGVNFQVSFGIASGSDGSIGLFGNTTGGFGGNTPINDITKSASASLSFSGTLDTSISSIKSLDGTGKAVGISSALPINGPAGSSLTAGYDSSLNGSSKTVSLGLGYGKPVGEAHAGLSKTSVLGTSFGEMATFWGGVTRSIGRECATAIESLASIPSPSPWF